MIWRVYFGLVPIPLRKEDSHYVSGIWSNDSISSHGQTSGAKMVCLGLGNVVYMPCAVYELKSGVQDGMFRA